MLQESASDNVTMRSPCEMSMTLMCRTVIMLMIVFNFAAQIFSFLLLSVYAGVQITPWQKFNSRLLSLSSSSFSSLFPSQTST